jgi:hypothetical protein
VGLDVRATVTTTASGSVALVLDDSGPRYAMLEQDTEGTLILLLSDRGNDDEAEAREVPAGEIGRALLEMAEYVTGT